MAAAARSLGTAPAGSLSRRSRRRLALLGGTTTRTDVAVAARYLLGGEHAVQGDAIRSFEREFAVRVGAADAFSFAAGRVGLYGILRALGIGEGDEVLVPVPTHVVVANAVLYTGARPVFVDCRLDDFNMDPQAAARALTPRTKAILLQHTFGVPADLEAFLALAPPDVALIEDCVHGLGATYDGRPVGSFGRAAFFSTEETKTISSTMGGVAVTSDEELARRLAAFQARCAWPPRSLVARYLLKLIAYHALTEPHVHRYARPLYESFGRRNPLPQPTTSAEQESRRPPRYERRLSNAQAHVALGQLRRLDQNVAHRDAIARGYADVLAPAGFHLADPPARARPSFVRFPVLVSDRRAAVSALAPFAVPGLWFRSVLSEAKDPASAGYVAGSCPNAETAARHLVNLPTHLRVEREDVEAMASALVEATGPGPAPGNSA